MCFRPSAVSGSMSQVQTSTCSKCGQPVAASVGITSGTCPYCGEPIESKPAGNAGGVNPAKDVKIL